jgi:hypothetical protein
VLQASPRGGSSGLPAKYAARAYGLFFPPRSGSVKPPSDDLSVRVSVFGMDHPPLRSTSAGHTTQEHRAADAANRVVMPGDIASNPVPHGRFLFQLLPADGKGCRSEGRSFELMEQFCGVRLGAARGRIVSVVSITVSKMKRHCHGDRLGSLCPQGCCGFVKSTATATDSRRIVALTLRSLNWGA